jgi:uncharacterized protein YceK
MKTNLIIPLLVFAVVLSGCSSILKGNVVVQEPKEGPRARVRVVVSTTILNHVAVRAYPNSECIEYGSPGNGMVVNSQIGFEANLNGQKIGMPKTVLSSKPRTNQAEVFVAANQPILFWYRGPDRSYIYPKTRTLYSRPSCVISITFIPEAGADYELEFAIKSADDCSYNATRLNSPDSSTPTEIPTVMLRNLGICKPRFYYDQWGTPIDQ